MTTDETLFVYSSHGRAINHLMRIEPHELSRWIMLTVAAVLLLVSVVLFAVAWWMVSPASERGKKSRRCCRCLRRRPTRHRHHSHGRVRPCPPCPPRPPPPPPPGPSPPGPSPPGPSPPAGSPPLLTPDVFTVSAADLTATPVFNNSNSAATPPVVVLPDVGPLTATPVSAVANPNYIPAVLSGDFTYVASLSDNGQQPVLDIIKIGNPSVIVQTVLIPTDFQPLSVVSSVTPTGVNRFIVASRSRTGPAEALYSSVDETAPSSAIFVVQPAAIGVLGQPQDMRVSADNSRLFLTTDATFPVPNFYLFDITLPGVFIPLGSGNTQSAVYGGAFGANNLIPVSAAFTPDNMFVMLVLTAGTGADRILKLSAVNGAFLAVAESGAEVRASPPNFNSTAVKIIALTGTNANDGLFFVGRRGTDNIDSGLWSNAGFPANGATNGSLIPGGPGDGTGVTDIQSAPAGMAAYSILYAQGTRLLVVRVGPGPFFSLLGAVISPPATRLSYSRDGRKLYLGQTTSSSSPAMPVTFVTEVDVFDSGAMHQVGPTDNQPWYVASVSSAFYTGGQTP